MKTRQTYNTAVKNSSSDYLFWDTPLYWEERQSPDGWRISTGITPMGIMSRVVQPWTVLFKFLTLR